MFASKTLPKFEPGHRDGDGCVFPTPGHFTARQRNKPNPMLVAFRESGHKADHYLWIAGSSASTNVRWGTEASAHARKVLTRLVNLTAVTS